MANGYTQTLPVGLVTRPRGRGGAPPPQASRGRRVNNGNAGHTANLERKLTNQRAQIRQLQASKGSAPRAQAQPKRRARRGGLAIARPLRHAGHGYYDAFVNHHDKAAVSNAVGPCTPITGAARMTCAPGIGVDNVPYLMFPGSGLTVTDHLTSNCALFVFNPGSSDDVVGSFLTLKTIANGVDGAPSSTSLHGQAGVHQKLLKCSQFKDLLGPTIRGVNHDAETQVAAALNSYPNQLNPGRRVESIPLRGSLRIRNVTEVRNRGGVVRVLRYNGSLNFSAKGADDTNYHSDMTALHEDGTFGAHGEQLFHVAGFLQLCEMIRDSPQARNIDGAEFMTTFQGNTYPSDYIRAHEFRDDDTFWETVAHPKFCTTLVLIDNYAPSGDFKNNQFEVNTVVQRAARFAPGSLLHAMARTLPSADQNTANSHVQQEAANPHLQQVKDFAKFAGGAIAGAATGVAGGVYTGLRSAQAVAPFIELAAL